MIYVIAHTAFDTSLLDPVQYQVLHVGASECSDPAWLRDNTGDQISDRNNSYCELTGLYWIWRNIQESPQEVTGLVHYRRYFTTREENKVYQRSGVMPTLLSAEVIGATVASGRMILPVPATTVTNVYRTYARMHYAADLDVTRECIHECTPQYDKDFLHVMHAHHASYGNMFLSDRKTLDAYCEWLFPILFAVEERLGEQHRDSTYQKRVMGFLGERLLNVWVRYNEIPVSYYPVFNTQETGMTAIQLAAYRAKMFCQVVTGKYRRRDK